MRSPCLLLLELQLSGNDHAFIAGRERGGLYHADHVIHALLELRDRHEGFGIDRNAEMAQPLRLLARIIVEVANGVSDQCAGQDSRENLDEHRDPKSLVTADRQNPAAVENLRWFVGMLCVAVDAPAKRYLLALVCDVNQFATVGDAQRRIDKEWL